MGGRWRARLERVATVILALLLLCASCTMILAFVLTANTEINASFLGSDWRMWQLQLKGTNGVGVSQSNVFSTENGQACRHFAVWLITWKPQLLIDRSDYDDCTVSSGVPVLFANALDSVIIAPGGRS